MNLHIRIAAVIFFALISVWPANAQHVPTVVLQDLQTLVKDCSGNFDTARKSLRPIELNDDGISDRELLLR